MPYAATARRCRRSKATLVRSCPSPSPPNGKVEKGLSVSNDWVLVGEKKIFWLPADYRATCEAIKVNVLGYSVGR